MRSVSWPTATVLLVGFLVIVGLLVLGRPTSGALAGSVAAVLAALMPPLYPSVLATLGSAAKSASGPALGPDPTSGDPSSE